MSADVAAPALHIVRGQRELTRDQRDAVTREWTKTFLRRVSPKGHIYLAGFRENHPSQTRNVPCGDHGAVFDFADTSGERLNIYFGVAPRDDPNGRSIRYCLGLWAFFVDFDFKEAPESEVRARLEAFPLQPSAVIASGGGLHAYWFLSGPFYLLNGTVPRAKAILRALATTLGGDLVAAEPARILRLPGTSNFKYTPPRRVTFEYVDETRTYALDEILAALPPIPETPLEHLKDPVKHTMTVEARVEAARRWLTSQPPAVQGQGGDLRTYEVCCAVLIDHDLDEDGALVALKDWNARCQPPWPEHTLRKKLSNADTYSTGQRGTKLATRRVVITRASEIKPQPVLWFWQDRLALGTVSLLAGREGIGKSMAAYTLAAETTRGRLAGRCYGHPRNVIVAAAEDSWSHTIVPRLMAAGADLDRVLRVNVEVREVGKVELSLPDDISTLEQVIRDENAAMVLLDPVISRLNKKLDTHKDAEVRSALEPLARLADATSVSILGIIHVNKSTSRDPLTMVMGSRAFVAVARAVLFVVQDPGNERVRLLGEPKNNLGRTDLPTLSFEVEQVKVGETEDGPILTGKLRWTGESAQSIRSVVEESADTSGADRTAISEAASWINDHLTSKGGWDFASNIKKEGMTVGYSGKTIERARHRLNLVKKDFGFPRRTLWAFPNAEVPVQAEIDAYT